MATNFDISILKSQAEQISGQIIEYRRLFHKIPELKMETILTEQNIVKIDGLTTRSTKLALGAAHYVESGASSTIKISLV